MSYKEKKANFKRKVQLLSKKTGIGVKKLAVRPMRNKWASCSTNGMLSFDRELLDKNAVIKNYVIVHELLHIRVPNHGKLWKSYMNLYLGDYEKIERKLKIRNCSRGDII